MNVYGLKQRISALKNAVGKRTRMLGVAQFCAYLPDVDDGKCNRVMIKFGCNVLPESSGVRL